MSEEERRPLFTVLTPTYNRGRTLPRLYDSLRQQSCKDFEWVVVDDGSSDDTHELIERWAKEAPFKLRYVSQANRGKHVACNRGVQVARGTLIAQIDSDDEIVPAGLEVLAAAWVDIPEAHRGSFVGVTGLCEDEHGNIVGDEYPASVVDSDTLEALYRFGIRGEKWGFHRRDVLQAYPYPEPRDVRYVPPGIMWPAIARQYKTRFVNAVVRIYHTSSGPPGSQLTGASPALTARGLALWHKTILDQDLDWFFHAPLSFLRSAVHYVRFSKHAGFSATAQFSRLAGKARVLFVLMYVAGWSIYRKDLSKMT